MCLHAPEVVTSLAIILGSLLCVQALLVRIWGSLHAQLVAC
jgi:hypothetical protein